MGKQCDPSQKASLHGDPAVFSGLDLRVPCWNQGPVVIKWRHCWGDGGHWALETWLSSPRTQPAAGPRSRGFFVVIFTQPWGLFDEGAVAMGEEGGK